MKINFTYLFFGSFSWSMYSSVCYSQNRSTMRHINMAVCISSWCKYVSEMVARWFVPTLCTPKSVSRFTTRRPNFGSETSLLWPIHWSTYTTFVRFVSYVFVTSYHFITTQFVIYYLPHHLLSYPDLWIFWQKAVAGMPHRIHLVTFPESSIQHVDVLQRLCCNWF